MANKNETLGLIINNAQKVAQDNEEQFNKSFTLWIRELKAQEYKSRLNFLFAVADGSIKLYA